MNGSRTPAIIGAVLLVAAIVVFFVIQGGDDDGSSTTTAAQATTNTTAAETTPEEKPEKPEKPDKPAESEIETIVVKNGQPEGGVAELTFTEGDDIRFRVESDVAEEVHFHGYDVSEDVDAGGAVGFDVPATLTGVFEVELEHSVVPIAEITVNPA